MFGFYTRALKRYPKTTNAAMTGTLFGTGDIIAQVLFPCDKPYDVQRTMRSVIYGSMIFSIVGDKWYKVLNSINVSSYAALNTAIRVATDQLLFAPVGIPMYYTAMTLMEGGGTQDVWDKLAKSWWTTLTTNWAVWPVFQLFNFSLVPVQHRLLAVNTVSIFWNTYLSWQNSRVVKEETVPPV